MNIEAGATVEQEQLAKLMCEFALNVAVDTLCTAYLRYGEKPLHNNRTLVCSVSEAYFNHCAQVLRGHHKDEYVTKAFDNMVKLHLPGQNCAGDRLLNIMILYLDIVRNVSIDDCFTNSSTESRARLARVINSYISTLQLGVRELQGRFSTSKIYRLKSGHVAFDPKGDVQLDEKITDLSYVPSA